MYKLTLEDFPLSINSFGNIRALKHCRYLRISGLSLIPDFTIATSVLSLLHAAPNLEEFVIYGAGALNGIGNAASVKPAVPAGIVRMARLTSITMVIGAQCFAILPFISAPLLQVVDFFVMGSFMRETLSTNAETEVLAGTSHFLAAAQSLTRLSIRGIPIEPLADLLRAASNSPLMEVVISPTLPAGADFVDYASIWQVLDKPSGPGASFLCPKLDALEFGGGILYADLDRLAEIAERRRADPTVNGIKRINLPSVQDFRPPNTTQQYSAQDFYRAAERMLESVDLIYVGLFKIDSLSKTWQQDPAHESLSRFSY